jgi:hypothetical protein
MTHHTSTNMATSSSQCNFRVLLHFIFCLAPFLATLPRGALCWIVCITARGHFLKAEEEAMHWPCMCHCLELWQLNMFHQPVDNCSTSSDVHTVAFMIASAPDVTDQS